LLGRTVSHYVVTRALGAGAMGEVYEAHDTLLGRDVAIKILQDGGGALEESRLRFLQEARAASALNHPNIVTIHDVVHDGEIDCIVMELVCGRTLDDRITDGPIPLGETLDVLDRIADALTAAHARGIVHRDLKPANVMLTPAGGLKILDFGLAKLFAGLDGVPESLLMVRTQSGIVVGTPCFMSPEQVKGQPVDGRSDLFSLGSIAFEMLTGRNPFEADSVVATMHRIAYEEPPSMEDVPGIAIPMLDRLLARDPANRYQSADELRGTIAAIRTGTTTAAEPGPDVLPPTNLPQLLTPLVGRDAERDDIVSLLRRDHVRIVTLIGPGGTGKTRLSLAIANELLRAHGDGVWWISLGPIVDPRLVVSAIAAALEVVEGSVPLLDAIRNVTRDRTMLLVLDNFEQVLKAAPVVSEILAAAPRVKALVTSRSPLHIHGEHEYAVPPLTLPPLDLPLTLDVLESYGAVALFVERASAVKNDFALTAGNARAIAEICVRLDGLPLAIELAAARVKLLPPQAMLSRIQNRLKLLSGGARDLPERQQTMRAAISWGYQLLDDSQKSLFATLSVFRGGFSLGEAERLAGHDVLDGISSLLDNAFLRRDPNGRDDDPRFAMLETIREYGLECLAEAGRADDVLAAHARLMASIAEEHELDIERLAMDEDNFRTALESGMSAADAELALRLAAALWWSWYVRGSYSEGRRWVDEVLALPGGEAAPKRAKAMTGAGAMAFLQCDYDRATELLDEAIVLARAHGDRMSLAQSLQFRGSIARERGEYEQAIDLHLLSRTIWLELGDHANAGRSLNYVGFASWLNGDFQRTFDLCEGTRQMFRASRDTEGVAWSLLNLAGALLYSGNVVKAEQRLEECLGWSRESGFNEGIAWSLNLLGCVLRARGNDARAATMLKDSLRLHWKLGDRWRSASVLEALGGVLRDPRLIGAASALRAHLRAPVPPAERAQYDADLAAVSSVPCDPDDAVRIALE
jgi:predicted ATPase